MKGQKVSKATRLTYYDKNSNTRKTSRSVKLIFDVPILPQTINIGFNSYKIKLYVPNPIQCYKCQGYGHMAGNCSNKRKCRKCGEDHQSNECNTESPKCVNCKGDHPSNYKLCPSREQQKQALKVVKRDNITLHEANKQVKAKAKARPVVQQLEAEHTDIKKEGKFLLCGDFNAHHTMWGGKHTDTKGRELFSFLEYKDIVLLNDGTGTRCNPSTLELAPIDLSFCNSSLASKITWSVDLTSSYGSDHHVVNINFSHKQILTDDSESVYNYKKADWEAFSSKCNEHLSPDMISDNIEETCSRLTNKILQIAGECIPVKLKNNKPKKPQVPWWTPECTKSVKERNICKNRAQHTGFGTDFTIYREKERACRKTIKAAQAMYWESYCNSLNNDSKLSDVWKKVKSMLGKTFKKLNLPTLLYNNTKYECTQDKADILATNYAQVSSDDNYSDNFKSQKQDIEQKEYSKLLHYYIRITLIVIMNHILCKN
ncbi:Hypothetical predicted protein [Mytilus galloprovincialis]|uniref:CCHC-type domain-containing protein n=1 Tax=Mytilus galloprovincialis TaxID=29158 RepID=A0A8B6H2X0_MYTGA|nr:Hypothetical predicted protein [Mytilus galloprovincialis]